MIGEMTERGCKTRFVPSAVRQYRHDEIEVTPDMTGFALREKIGEMILENGKEHHLQDHINRFSRSGSAI